MLIVILIQVCEIHGAGKDKVLKLEWKLSKQEEY